MGHLSRDRALSALLPGRLARRLEEAAGAPCNVEVLDDAVEVREDTIVRVATLRLVIHGSRRVRVATLVGATRWEDVRITVVDGHTLRIGCGDVVIRRTYLDLGLFAENSREPTKKWDILCALCAGHGTFRWRDFGEFGAVKQAVSVLRNKLKEAFGLDEDPFHPWNGRWQVRFFASSEIGSGP
jgi:hypothetical protein